MSELIIKNTKRAWLGNPCRVEWKEKDTALTVNGKSIPTQIEETNGKTYLVFLPPPIDAGAEMRCLTGKTAPAAGVRINDNGGAVDVLIGNELFTTYHYSPDVARPFLNPVIGPGGKSVLRKPVPPDNPEKLDHKHHRGIWVAHGDTNGTDNWSEEPGHGRTVHRKFLEQTSGPVFGRVHAVSDWVSNKDRKILEEERIITVYNLPAERRVIDHRVVLRASEGEVVFRDTKESGFLSVRVATTMEVSHTGKFGNSYGGVNEDECWGKRAEWCDYYGITEGVAAGIAVFDHPGNERYPTWWHIRNYGLMTANFLGLSDFHRDKRISGTLVLPAYREMVLNHRIFIHPGDTVAGNVRDQYLNYLYQPELELK